MNNQSEIIYPIGLTKQFLGCGAISLSEAITIHNAHTCEFCEQHYSECNCDDVDRCIICSKRIKDGFVCCNCDETLQEEVQGFSNEHSNRLCWQVGCGCGSNNEKEKKGKEEEEEDEHPQSRCASDLHREWLASTCDCGCGFPRWLCERPCECGSGKPWLSCGDCI